MPDQPPKKRLTPIQADEAVPEGTATGVGGQRRRKTIDDIVDDAVEGTDNSNKKRQNQSTDSNNKY